MGRTAALAALLLAGCNAASPPSPAPARENDTTIVNPPGRYQMMRGDTDLSVVVLDTRLGSLSSCVNADGRYRCLPQWTEDEYRAHAAQK